MHFNDFILTHPTCSVVKNSTTARHIYDNIIWDNDIRIKMAEISDVDLPALGACVQQIESHCQTTPTCDLDITNDTVKQVIGRMISVSLAPLGYISRKKKRLPAQFATAIFKNATSYTKAGVATHYIKKSIMPIE